MTRTSSFCNLEAHAKFATADVLVACFDSYDTLTDWESCMEKQVGVSSVRFSFRFYLEYSTGRLNRNRFNGGPLPTVALIGESFFWKDGLFSRKIVRRPFLFCLIFFVFVPI